MPKNQRLLRADVDGEESQARPQDLHASNFSVDCFWGCSVQRQQTRVAGYDPVLYLNGVVCRWAERLWNVEWWLCSSGGARLIIRSRTPDEAVAVDKASGVQMPSAVEKQDYLTCKDVWMIDERSAKQRE